MNDVLAVARPLVLGLMGVCGLIYGVGAVWFATGMGMGRRRREGSGMLPTVSIVVAARDEEEHIEQCLAALSDQDYPAHRYEVIVVDDGSRDRTAERVRQNATDRVRLVRTEEKLGWSGSKKAALSLGIATATGEIILTTDADCRVGPGWIRALVSHFQGAVGMVVGFSQVRPEEAGRRWLAGYEATDFLALMGCIAGSIGHGHPMAASGQNLAYRKEVFTGVGGYSGLMDRGASVCAAGHHRERGAPRRG